MIVTDHEDITTINDQYHGKIINHDSVAEFNRGHLLSFKSSTEDFNQDRLILKMLLVDGKYYLSFDDQGDEIQFDLDDHILTNLDQLPDNDLVEKGFTYALHYSYESRMFNYSFVRIK